MSLHQADIDETEATPLFERRFAADKRTLVIACGALAREILSLRDGPLGAFDVMCLPASLHNRPERIPEAMRGKIRANRDRYDGVKRIEGAHCYAYYTGLEAFDALAEEEIGTFYLTDFLARHFETLVIRGLGLDRYPQLQADYFGHYRRLVYLAQTDDADLTQRAEAAAERLGLAFERRYTGLGGLTKFLAAKASTKETVWPA